MPPPLGIEEDEELERQEASSSDSDELIEVDSPTDVDFPEESIFPQQAPEPELELEFQEQQREASPVHLVTSDIVTTNAARFKTAALPSAPKPDKFKMKNEDKAMKRQRTTGISNPGPLAKKRKGNRRQTPCVYCVRRLANDPKWQCQEAMVSQTGAANYSGTRCSGCVRAHVSCHSIPDKATEAVRTLVKAANDAVASDGSAKIQPLAAYEAAIGPALRAIIVPPSEYNPEAQKQKRARKSGSKPQPNQYSNASKQQPSSWAEAAGPDKSFSSARADPANFFAPPPQQHQNAADVEKLERQALRRRKVEALESISHTAALFLAEFMTFAKQQSSFSSSGAGPSAEPGSGDGQQNHGMVYAAAAAGMSASMFRPLASANTYHQPYSNRTSAEAYFDNAGDSDSDDSNVSTIENNDHTGFNTAAQTQTPFNAPATRQQASSQGGEMSAADFGSSVEVYEDEDVVAQKHEEGRKQRQESEVKVEDG